MSRVDLRQQLSQLPADYRDSVIALFDIRGGLTEWLLRNDSETVARLQVWLNTRGA